MIVLRRILLWALLALGVTAGLAGAVYLRDMSRAYERVRQHGDVVRSPYGDIEYMQGGSARVRALAGSARLGARCGARDVPWRAFGAAARGVASRACRVAYAAVVRRHVRVLAEQSAASRKGDTLQLFANAEFAARSIPGARLLAFEHGGHVVTIVEQAAIRAAVREHVLGHARAAR